MARKIKLNAEDIISIRKIYRHEDINQKDLADLFKISQGHLSRIVRGLRRENVK